MFRKHYKDTGTNEGENIHLDITLVSDGQLHAPATISLKHWGNINWVSDLDDATLGEEYPSVSKVGFW